MPFRTGSDFERFADWVKSKYRYFEDDERKNFLAAVAASAASRAVTLSEGSKLWRAQLGMGRTIETEQDDGSVVIEFNPHPEERMIPHPKLAIEGRGHPIGIPALYAATDSDTAMSEIRPNNASYITLAELILSEDITLVDCSHENGKSIYEYDGAIVPSDEIEGVVWRSISDAFTRPVDPVNGAIEYVPSQILAEHFKYLGYGGIRYRSGYDTGGHNVVLFELNAAKVGNRSLHQVRRVKFDFEPWP
jgi:hypothetical protein